MCFRTPYDGSDGSSVDVFLNGNFGFTSMGVDAILRNGCGTYGQNYVVLLQESEVTAGYHYRGFILGI